MGTYLVSVCVRHPAEEKQGRVETSRLAHSFNLLEVRLEGFWIETSLPREGLGTRGAASTVR